MVADALGERDGVATEQAHIPAMLAMAIVADRVSRSAADAVREELQSVMRRAFTAIDPRSFA